MVIVHVIYLAAIAAATIGWFWLIACCAWQLVQSGPSGARHN
jgi:hypothetical protein